MARELRRARCVGEVPIQDQIAVAASSEGSASTVDVDSPPGQATNNSRGPRGHPTPARGPNLVDAVVDNASKLAKAKPRHRVYCDKCKLRKSQPAVNGSRNGNAIHKCLNCQYLTEKPSEQAQQPRGKRKAEQPAQPERQDAPVAGKEQSGRPKSNKRQADEHIPGKREYIALAYKPQQKEDNDSEPGTESDDPEKPVLSNRSNPGVDKFGCTKRFVKSGSQTPGNLSRRHPSSQPGANVHQADFYDDQGRPVYFNSAKAPAQDYGPSDPQLAPPPPDAPPETVNPAALTMGNSSGAAEMYPDPERTTQPGHFATTWADYQHSEDVEASMASRSDGTSGTHDVGNFNPSLYNNALQTSPPAQSNSSDLQSIAVQALSPSQSGPTQQPPAIDPRLLLAWGKPARHPELTPTSTDPMFTGEQYNPVNSLPALTGDDNSASSNYDYANPDWTPEEKKAAFKDLTCMYDSDPI